MTKPISLSHFIRDENTQLRCFDLGRRVTKIRLSDFEKFEQRELAYPYPYQQTAWVGILFWNVKNKEQHNIWFIRMPLDEQGFINVASRDEFLDMILSRIGEQIAAKNADTNADTNAEENELAHALKDNPYVFKPTEENMACFHAKATQILNIPPSRFLADMISYLSGKEFDSWQHLGIQGFADIAVRQDKAEINKLLCKAISTLPDAPYCAICNALENETCTPALMDEVVKVIRQILSEEQERPELINRLVSSIRAVANMTSTDLKHSVITEILKSHFASNSSVIIMIAAKCWEALDDNALLKLYLETLAANPAGETLFNALMADQMFLPGKRDQILKIFRDPDRSDALSAAVGSFFQQVSN